MGALIGMSITIAFTYDKTSPESVIDGDLSDHGFCDNDGSWEYSMNNPECVADTKANPDLYFEPWEVGNLRIAIRAARSLGISGEEWNTPDGSIDNQSGETTYYSFHVEGITPAIRQRITRALNGRRVLQNKL